MVSLLPFQSAPFFIQPKTSNTPSPQSYLLFPIMLSTIRPSPMHPPTTHLPVPPPTLHPLLPPQLDNFNISSRIYSLEDQIRKASTAVSNLTNELEAIKTEVHKNNFNDSSDKINTFLQKAVIWSEKLEELFKHSKQQAQLVTDMAGTLETNMQREMEELRTNVNKITAKKSNDDLMTELSNLNKRIEAVEEEPGTQSGARIDNLEKLVDDLTTERVGQLERRMQVAEEEMEHKFADITNKNTANNTSLQKIQGDIKTLTSDIEKESKNNLQLAHKIEENTKQVAKVGLDLVAVAWCKQGIQTDNQQTQFTERLKKLEIASYNATTDIKSLISILNFILRYIKHITSGHKSRAWNEFLNKVLFQYVPDHIRLSESIYFPKFLL